MHHIQEIRKILKSVLTDQLSDYLYSVLSNMLAIDFKARQIDKIKSVDQHGAECANRILKYLGSSNLLSDKFEDALKLFLVAISEDDNINKRSYDQIKETALQQENMRNAPERLLSDMKQDPELNKLKNSPSSFVSGHRHTKTNAFQNRMSEKQKNSPVIAKLK